MSEQENGTPPVDAVEALEAIMADRPTIFSGPMMYYTAKEAAELLGVTETRIRTWIDRGFVTTPIDRPGKGRPRRFTAENLAEMEALAASAGVGLKEAREMRCRRCACNPFGFEGEK